jgi:hypothetical protein
MTATLKRKMWMVAAIHFCLTLLVFASLFDSGWSGNPHSKAYENYRIKTTLKFDALFLLQPQLGVLSMTPQFLSNALLAEIPIRVLAGVLLVFWFGSIPVCSFCVGWIYAKSVGWLNHFPVLGKKVF